VQPRHDAGGKRTPPKTTPRRAPDPGPGFGTELRGRFRYRLIKRLGRGAFGSVYFARCVDHDSRRDDSPPEQVAVKILGSSNGAGMQMLRRELAALLAIRCDRIPRVYDWSLDGEHAFVVMEYFAHGSLRDAMPLQGPVPDETVWRLLADLLTALDVAHRASVLHLDIKPANVLVDGNGGYVLTDFGVSQASHIDRGLLPFSVGTRGYQAPEQRNERFDQYDLRTDLWGVGATAWAFATGINLAERPDLVRDEDGETVYGLPPLSDLRIHCSTDLDDVVMSMLALDPARRPGGVAEVLARVQAALSGAAFESTSPPVLPRSAAQEAEVDALVESLVDPLLIAICRRAGFREYIARFEDGAVMCTEGEKSYRSFLLLKGTVAVSRDGREITRVSGEGSFLGEVAALTSMPLTASFRASGTVWACVLTAADLERFITFNPAMGLRVIRTMAHRLSRLRPEKGSRHAGAG
jgi:hypothetical protein